VSHGHTARRGRGSQERNGGLDNSRCRKKREVRNNNKKSKKRKTSEKFAAGKVPAKKESLGQKRGGREKKKSESIRGSAATRHGSSGLGTASTVVKARGWACKRGGDTSAKKSRVPTIKQSSRKKEGRLPGKSQQEENGGGVRKR